MKGTAARLSVVLAMLLLAIVPGAHAQQAMDADEAGDVRPDAQSGTVDEPDIDILEARALVDGQDLVLGLRVAGRPAFDAEPTGREVTYLWVVAFDAPAGTRPFHQQDAIIVCSGQEGGQADCVVQKGPFTNDDIEAGVFDDTLTLALRIDGAPPETIAVGAASNVKDAGTIVGQDFTPGADPFGGRSATPTTEADDAPWPMALGVAALIGLAIRRRSA